MLRWVFFTAQLASLVTLLVVTSSSVKLVGSPLWPVMGRRGDSNIFGLEFYPFLWSSFRTLGSHFNAIPERAQVISDTLQPLSTGRLARLARSTPFNITVSAFHLKPVPYALDEHQRPMAGKLFGQDSGTCYSITYSNILPCPPRKDIEVQQLDHLSSSALWIYYSLAVCITAILLYLLRHSHWLGEISGKTALERLNTQQACRIPVIQDVLAASNARLAELREKHSSLKVREYERDADHMNVALAIEQSTLAYKTLASDAQGITRLLDSEIQRLEGRLIAHEADEARLREENNAVSRQLESRVAKDAARDSIHRELASQRQTRITNVLEKQKALRSQIFDGQAQGSADTEAHSRTVVALQNKLQLKTNELVLSRSRIDQRSSQQISQQGFIDQAVSEIDDIRQQNSRLCDTYEERETQLDITHNPYELELDSAQATITATEARNSNDSLPHPTGFQVATTDAKALVDRASYEIDTLRQKLADILADNETLASHAVTLRDDLREQRQEEQDSSSTHTQHIEELQGCVHTEEGKLKAAAGRVKLHSDEINSLEHDLKKSRAFAAQIQEAHLTDVAGKHSSTALSGEDLERNTDANADLRREVDDLQQFLDSKSLEAGTLESQYATLEASSAVQLDSIQQQITTQREQHRLGLYSVNEAISALVVAHAALASSQVEETRTHTSLTVQLEKMEEEKTRAIEAIHVEDIQAQAQHEANTTQTKMTSKEQRSQLQELSSKQRALKAKKDELEYKLAVSINDESNLRVAGWEIEAQMREDAQVYRSCDNERINRTRVATRGQQAAAKSAEASEKKARKAQIQLDISRAAFKTQLKDISLENATLEEDNEGLRQDNRVLRGQLAAQDTAHSTELDDLASRLQLAEAKARSQVESDVLLRQDARIVELESAAERLQSEQLTMKADIQMHAEARANAEEETKLKFQDNSSSKRGSGLRGSMMAARMSRIPVLSGARYSRSSRI